MKIFKNYFLIGLLSLTLVSIVLSCKDDDDDDLIGNWVEHTTFKGHARYDAVAFSIGNIGYVGLGVNDNDIYKDFYRYDPDNDTWTQITNFEGKARTAAVAFTAAGKGYVGTGYDGYDRLSDFWSYDPDANAWDSIEVSNPPSAREDAVAFTINDIGYVATGYDGSCLQDMWAFDPVAGSWTQKADYHTKVRDAVAFVIDNKGYICTGYNNSYDKNCYMYDPETNLWYPKRKIDNVSDDSYDDDYTIVREKAVAFVIDSKAYIATGVMSGYKNDVWEYDPNTDLWDEKTNFEGTTRKDAVAFTTADGRAFVATGTSSSSSFYDLFEFKPLDEYDDED